jgi:ABC-type proline/glycine betaine transport system substrate-binding protein
LEYAVEVVVPTDSEDLFEPLPDAYLEGKPWLGYLYGPTQVASQFELTRLEEDPYSDECWEDHKMCAYDDSRIRKVVNLDMTAKAGEVVDFLRLWHLDEATQIEAESFLAQVALD